MSSPEATAAPTAGPPLRLILAVVVVLVLPVLVLVVPLAALTNWALGKFWPDRLVAWLLVGVGAVSAAVLLLLLDLPGAALRLFYGWWPSPGVDWPSWVPVAWFQAHWPGAPSVD